MRMKTRTGLRQRLREMGENSRSRWDDADSFTVATFEEGYSQAVHDMRTELDHVDRQDTPERIWTFLEKIYREIAWMRNELQRPYGAKLEDILPEEMNRDRIVMQLLEELENVPSDVRDEIFAEVKTRLSHDDEELHDAAERYRKMSG